MSKKKLAGIIIGCTIVIIVVIALIIFHLWRPTPPLMYSLNVDVSPSGAGSVSLFPPGGTYESGEQVILTANATTGYAFDHWGGDWSGVSPPSSSIGFPMYGNYSITAYFKAIYDLTTNSTEGGLVTEPGENTFTYDEETLVNLIAEADTCYEFINWTGDVGTIADVNAASTNITMNGNYSTTANFALLRYNLTADSTDGGSVTAPGEGAFNYDCGDVVNLVATPDAGYHFVNWTGDADTIANVNTASTTITMNSDKTITAYFSNVQITYIFYDGVVYRTESDEYVEITNLGDTSQDLKGWLLKDISEGYPSFTFPSYVLAPGAKVRVYTNEIHPEWGGFSFGSGKAVWNNSIPDTAVLKNAEGQEVSRKSY